MIPSNRTALTATAIRHGWDVKIDHDRGTTEAYFDRGGASVAFIWDDGVLVWSGIDRRHTPYQQCTRLIRNPEGN